MLLGSLINFNWVEFVYNYDYSRFIGLFREFLEEFKK